METNTLPPTFFIPQGNLLEARFYNFVKANEIEEAHQLLLDSGKDINVNTTIDGRSLIAHVIDEFSQNYHEENIDLYNGLILLMCYMRPNLNQYDEEKETTLFTQLFGCDLYLTTLTYILKNVPVWINPEEELPQNQKITKTPLGEAASNFDREQVQKLCEAGANPDSRAYTSSAAESIIEYTLILASDNEYFKDVGSTNDVLEIVTILCEHGATVYEEFASFIKDEYKNNLHNNALSNFIDFLTSRQQPHAMEL